MHITAKFQTPWGEIEIPNILEISWGASRQPHVNHEMGQVNHQLEPVTIVRTKSLMKDGKNQNETDIIKLAAATGDKGYFKATIRIAPPTDPNNPIQTIQWDRGHIIGLYPQITDRQIVERILIATTNLKVDDSKFELSKTT